MSVSKMYRIARNDVIFGSERTRQQCFNPRLFERQLFSANPPHFPTEGESTVLPTYTHAHFVLINVSVKPSYPNYDTGLYVQGNDSMSSKVKNEKKKKFNWKCDETICKPTCDNEATLCGVTTFRDIIERRADCLQATSLF